MNTAYAQPYLVNRYAVNEKGRAAMIKNIVFDYGKVLAEWDPRDMVLSHGGSAEKAEKFKKAFDDAGIWNDSDRSVIPHDLIEERAFKAAPDCEKEIGIYFEYLPESIVPYDYHVDLINACKAAGYGVYLLSNYGEWAFRKCQAYGCFDFLPMVDGALFSYEINRIKPEREIYQTFCDRFGLKPRECVFLDDVPINVQGAIDFGMEGLLFTGLPKALEDLKKLGVEIPLVI